MFRVLSLLRQRGEAKTGHHYSGPITFLGAVRDWLADLAMRNDRRILGLLTVLLILCIAVFATLAERQRAPGSDLLPPQSDQ